MNEDDLERFTGYFGGFGDDPFIRPIPGHDHIIAVKRKADETAPLFAENWHSDWSFQARPPAGTCLFGITIPPVGGNTEFLDTRVAWDHLPQETKAEIKDLIAYHSLIYSRAQLGFEAFSPEEQERCAPVPQRLVRLHQESGRLALYLSAHIGALEGWQRPEALALINHLTEFATQREFVYAHQWSVGDLVIWDNRCTMHRGVRFEDKKYPRDMRRVTLEDVGPTLEQAI
jgi:alpha-ketoglutarate-dependent 2,4-dichlorophenoxyacetate dioxygenase